MIEKKTDNRGSILYIRPNAVVSLKAMLNGLKSIDNDNDLPKDLRLFEDATDVHITFSLDDIDLLVEGINEIAKKFNTINHAVLHNIPENTALAMLLKQYKSADNYTLRIFSTKEAALKWLGNV